MLTTVFSHLRRMRMQTLKPFGQLSSDTIRISFGDTNLGVAKELAASFDGVSAAEVVVGNLLDLNCDAIVSPANSIGDMGGGIDKAIDDFHQGEAQRRLMAAIAEQFYGELPVGVGLVVRVSNSRFPFLVAAPTMRIPANVSGSINAYLSMRAALVAVLRHNATGSEPIRSMAVPGLGTGVGGLQAREAAEQMRVAYDYVIEDKWRGVVNAIQLPFALRGRGL
jgi:O-acetyl-ADP-ribose deacetylase (regulator of RNase III)